MTKTLSSLSTTRSADRAAIAKAAIEVAAKYGVSCEQTWPENLPKKPNCSRLLFTTKEGLSVYISIGLHYKDNTFFLPWHVEYGYSTRLSAKVFPSRNPYHRQKSSEVAGSPEQLIQRLDTVFKAVQDGTAFEPGSVKAPEVLTPVTLSIAEEGAKKVVSFEAHPSMFLTIYGPTIAKSLRSDMSQSFFVTVADEARPIADLTTEQRQAVEYALCTHFPEHASL